MNNKLTFEKLHNVRKRLIEENNRKDHVIIEGNNNIIISAPHGVSQVRLGKQKPSEIGSLATALFLRNNSNSFLIVKTRNNNDDANFDEVSNYKNSIKKLINKHNM